MLKISEIIKKGNCTGCGACKNVCNINAISMELNRDGFYEPSINKSKCVNCGLCDKTCAIVNPQFKNLSNPSCYALMADDDIRAVSSSGGAFSFWRARRRRCRRPGFPRRRCLPFVSSARWAGVPSKMITAAS